MRFVQARGSFYEVAQKVGEACRSDIPEIYELGIEYLLKHTKVGSRARIDQIAARYMSVAEKLWAPSVQFLRGLAEGANVPIEIIAVTAFTEEISSEAGILPSDKCSTLVVWLSNGYCLLIHNEDFEKHNRGKMVLLDVTFDGFPRTVGLTYSGQLFNLAGSLTVSKDSLLAMTNNGFHPLAQPGNPKQVLHARASLAQSMRGAKNWLAMQPIAVTTHYTVVCGRTNEAVSLVVSNLKTAKQESSLVPISNTFYCTNHVPPGRLDLRLPDPAVEISPNSFARYDELARIVAEELPQTPEQALKLFTENKVLFRESEEEGASVTLATVVICPQTGDMWVRDADPSATQREHYFCLRDE